MRGRSLKGTGTPLISYRLRSTDEKQRWSAWVTVDGRSLETYKVQRSATKTTCFIESTEEQTFQVVVKNENYPQTFAADLYVDGLRCAASVVGRPPSGSSFADARGAQD